MPPEAAGQVLLGVTQLLQAPLVLEALD